MDTQPSLLVVKAVLLVLQAAWLTLGAVTNLRFPRHNRDYVVSVMSMALISERRELYEAFAHRRILNPRIHRLAFGLVVAAEVLVSLLLWLGVAALLGAELGFVMPHTALGFAVTGVVAFIGIWGGFLVGGEWFVYWASPDSPQYTHFFMLLWGIATLIVILI